VECSSRIYFTKDRVDGLNSLKMVHPDYAEPQTVAHITEIPGRLYSHVERVASSRSVETDVYNLVSSNWKPLFGWMYSTHCRIAESKTRAALK
jgi:hypothetical protein